MEGKIAVSGFERIQVNGGILVREAEYICEMYPRHTIITQHHANSSHLLSVSSLNHAILIDASGGRGQSPNQWHQTDTSKCVGFAGGIGPENIAEELRRIRAFARQGWWVDMEGKLRVNDWFSIERAAACVEAFSAARTNGHEKQ